MQAWTLKDTVIVMLIGLVTTVQNGWDHVVANVMGVAMVQMTVTVNIAP